MPIWEDYQVTATISYEVRSRGQFICSGATPGEAQGTSNREVNGLTMEEALMASIAQAGERARAAIRASEALRRKEIGYTDGD